MTVEEIKAKLPEANVYELGPDAKYLIVTSTHQVSSAAAQMMIDALNFLKVKAAILHVDNTADAIRILEVRD